MAPDQKDEYTGKPLPVLMPTIPAPPQRITSKKRVRTKKWKPEEDELLMMTVIQERKRMNLLKDWDQVDYGEQSDDEEDWDEIAKSVHGRTGYQCCRRFQLLHPPKAQKSLSSTPTKFDSEAPTEETTKPTSVDRKRSCGEVVTPDSYSRKKPTTRCSDGSFNVKWPDEDYILLATLISKYDEVDLTKFETWNKIATHFRGKFSASDCRSKWRNEPIIKGKGSWTTEEDNILKERVAALGRKWVNIAESLPGRMGKQCRERWVNHLDPSLIHTEWTHDEEAMLIVLHEKYGNKWSQIARDLLGRSDNSVKNHWYSTIRRKFEMHGKEVLVAAATKQVRENLLSNTCAEAPVLVTQSIPDAQGRNVLDAKATVSRANSGMQDQVQYHSFYYAPEYQYTAPVIVVSNPLPTPTMPSSGALQLQCGALTTGNDDAHVYDECQLHSV